MRELPIIIHGSAYLRERTAMRVHNGVGRAYANQYALYERLHQQLLNKDSASRQIA
jgi:hypothetical protein